MFYPEKSEEENFYHILIQALGVCYYHSLENREGFRKMLSRALSEFGIGISDEEIRKSFLSCQETLLKEILRSEESVSCNQALMENLYMMAICVEVRIPLFIIGKPGSSKSLAKTILSKNMQGRSSYSSIFKALKQVGTLSIIAYFESISYFINA